MIVPKLIWILLNAAALLLLARAQLASRRVAAEPARSPRRWAEAPAAAPPPPARRPARVRGEARLVERVARWRARAAGGESLPRAAESCRSDRRESMTERIA